MTRTKGFLKEHPFKRVGDHQSNKENSHRMIPSLTASPRFGGRKEFPEGSRRIVIERSEECPTGECQPEGGKAATESAGQGYRLVIVA